MSDLAEIMSGILSELTRIADALEASQPKPKAAKPKADLFDVNAERAVRGKKPARAMPEGFHLNGELRAFAAKNGFAVCDFMFDQFIAYHQRQGSRFVDWEAAWRTWVLNQVKFSGGAPQQPRPSNDGMDGRI